MDMHELLSERNRFLLEAVMGHHSNQSAALTVEFVLAFKAVELCLLNAKFRRYLVT